MSPIKVIPTADDWQPLDRRWLATIRVGTQRKLIGAYGATREDATAALQQKLTTLGHGDEEASEASPIS